MYIVQINICDNGSTGKIMRDIMNALPTDRIESKAYVSRKYTDDKRVVCMHTKFRYRVHKFLSMYLGLDELGSYFSTKKVVKELKKRKPDILHLHNIHNHTINYRVLFKFIKQYDIPVVWTLHDCWAFTGGCFHFEYNGCYKWKSGCGDCRFLRDVGMAVPIDCTKREYCVKRKCFTGVKHMVLVTPSQWLKNWIEQSYMQEYPVTVINNGINLNNFKPTYNHTFDDKLDRSKKILLGVASPFGEKKGFSDFIKLSQIIDKDKRVIGLNIYQQNKDLIIEEYNYYQNDRRINADGLITTNKQDSHNHGLGLRSIKYIVNHYNGTLKLSLEEKEKMFFLKIVIPIKKLPSNNEK